MWNRVWMLLNSEAFCAGCKAYYGLLVAMGLGRAMPFEEEVYSKSGAEPQQTRKAGGEIDIAENQSTKFISQDLTKWETYSQTVRR